MTLAISPCRSLCDWAPAGELFACGGCGSQWEPSQGWTPRQADGTVPPAVLAARAGRSASAERADGAGSAGS